MSEEGTSADERHLKRMRDTIEEYFAKRIPFNRVLNNLGALLEAMEIVPGLLGGSKQAISEALSRLLVMVETQRLARKAGS